MKSLHTVVGDANLYFVTQNRKVVPQKLKLDLPHDPVIPIMDKYPNKIKRSEKMMLEPRHSL